MSPNDSRNCVLAARPSVDEGERFGTLTVSGRVFCVKAMSSGQLKREQMCVCVCDCGDNSIYRVRCLPALKAGCKRCGYVVAAKKRVRHGKAGDPIYNTWICMRSRCHDESNSAFPNYGGRGIAVCEQWRTGSAAFFKWAAEHGYRQGLAIDRIDTNGNYEPSNCRFVSAKENNRNKRTNRHVTAFGETKPVADWVDDPRCHVGVQTLLSRLNHGRDPERAMTDPLHSRKGRRIQ